VSEIGELTFAFGSSANSIDEKPFSLDKFNTASRIAHRQSQSLYSYLFSDSSDNLAVDDLVVLEDAQGFLRSLDTREEHCPERSSHPVRSVQFCELHSADDHAGEDLPRVLLRRDALGQQRRRLEKIKTSCFFRRTFTM
jgi:hypothetical protein